MSSRLRGARKRRPAKESERISWVCEIVGWLVMVLLVGLMVAWRSWQDTSHWSARPVAAHTTPLIRGRCAVDRETHLVWGRVVALGSSKGRSHLYVVQTLTRPRRLVELPIASLRVVACEEVTGPRTLDYGSRPPRR
jgi:hypothetical protein